MMEQGLPKRVELVGFLLIFLAFLTLFFNELFGFEGVFALLLAYTVFIKYTYLRGVKTPFTKADKSLVFVIGFYIFILYLSNFINFSNAKELESFASKYTKVFYFIAFVYLFKFIKFDFSSFELFIKAISYSIVLVLIGEVYVNGLGSHLGGEFSNKGTGAWFFSSVLISTLFLAVFSYKNHKKSEATHYALLSIILLLIIIFTSTRSIWLSIFVTLAVMLPILLGFYGIGKTLSKKLIFLMAFGLVVVFSLAFNKLETRFGQAVSDIQQIKDGNFYTSLGLRVVMYGMAVDGFVAKPLTGIGEVNYKRAVDKVYQSSIGSIDELVYKEITSFKHVHNQVLMDAWMKGVIGVISLLLMFVIPFILFFRRIGRCPQGILAFMGIAYLINSFVFLQFGAAFSYSHGLIFFFLWLILLIFTISNTKNHAPIFLGSKKDKEEA